MTERFTVPVYEYKRVEQTKRTHAPRSNANKQLPKAKQMKKKRGFTDSKLIRWQKQMMREAQE